MYLFEMLIGEEFVLMVGKFLKMDLVETHAWLPLQFGSCGRDFLANLAHLDVEFA